MRQRSLTISTSSRKPMVAESVENQYLVGACSPSGHSTSSHSSGRFLGEPVIAMCRTDAYAGKARGQPFCCTFTPCDLTPSMRGQANRKLLDRNRSVLAITPQQLRRSPTPRPRLRRSRPRSSRPDRRLWLDAGHIAQAKCGDILAQSCVGAIAGVHQDYAARQARRTGKAQMIKCNCRLGLEGDLFGYTGFAPALTVRRPLLWQIQTISHRQARMMICKRKAHGDLTIVLLAQLAAILPCNPDRMPSLLGKARIIDDPSFDRPVAFDVRQHHLPDFGQNLLVRPVALTDKMQQ